MTNVPCQGVAIMQIANEALLLSEPPVLQDFNRMQRLLSLPR